MLLHTTSLPRLINPGRVRCKYSSGFRNGVWGSFPSQARFLGTSKANFSNGIDPIFTFLNKKTYKILNFFGFLCPGGDSRGDVACSRRVIGMRCWYWPVGGGTGFPGRSLEDRVRAPLTLRTTRPEPFRTICQVLLDLLRKCRGIIILDSLRSFRERLSVGVDIMLLRGVFVWRTQFYGLVGSRPTYI